MTDNRQRKQQILVITALCFVCLFVFLFIGRPMLEFVADADAFREWVEQSGWMGRVVFLLMLVFQVVFAFIPGGVFEVAGGYAFGAAEGILLSVIGTTLGSASVFLLVKKFGMKFVLLFFSREQLDSAKFLHNKKQLYFIVFIAFIIPGTPKDLLCYAAGLTDMKLGAWLAVTTVARFPAIAVSAMGGDAIGTESYAIAIVIFAVIAAVAAVGILVYRRITEAPDEGLDL